MHKDKSQMNCSEWERGVGQILFVAVAKDFVLLA